MPTRIYPRHQTSLRLIQSCQASFKLFFLHLKLTYEASGWELWKLVGAWGSLQNVTLYFLEQVFHKSGNDLFEAALQFCLGCILETKRSQIQTTLEPGSCLCWVVVYSFLDVSLFSLTSPVLYLSRNKQSASVELLRQRSLVSSCVLPKVHVELRVLQLPNWVLEVKHDSWISPLHATVQTHLKMVWHTAVSNAA